MEATNPKARSYFTKLLSKAGDVTPRRENVINLVVEVETVKDDHVAGPSKKSKKRDRSGKRSHSFSRCHRDAEGGSSEPFPESIFGVSTKICQVCSNFFF